MEELQEPRKKPSEVKIPRRQFLKTLAGATLAATIGGEIRKEVGSGEGREIETKYGIFVPLYEVHSIGIDPQDIPKDTDIFFKELILLDETMFEAKAEDLLIYLLVPPESSGGKTVREFPKYVLPFLAKDGTEIMFGDVSINERRLKGLDKIFDKYGLAVGGGLVGELIISFADVVFQKQIVRRELLEILFKGALGAILWGATGFVVPLIAEEAAKIFGNSRVEKAVKNIIYRLGSLSLDIHPEEFIWFFRSLFIAEKLLAVAEDEFHKKGRKLKIAFNVGGAHSNMEDFLVLGRSFCQTLISLHPKSFLEEVIKESGGLDDLCSSRLLKVSKDYLSNRNPDLITERRVVDEGLKEKLKTFGEMPEGIRGV